MLNRKLLSKHCTDCTGSMMQCVCNFITPLKGCVSRTASMEQSRCILWISLPAVSIVLFGIAWIFIGMVNVMFAGIFQSVIPNHLLGRVNSVMTSISVIAMPIGSLLGGYFATRMQPSLLLAAAGGGIFFIAVVWLLHPRLRQLPAVTQIDRSILSLNIPEEKKDVELSKPINPQCKTIG